MPHKGHARISPRILAGCLVLGGILAIPPITQAVQFDVHRVVECREIPPEDTPVTGVERRTFEATINVSVRFEGDEARYIDEISIELDGSEGGLRVVDFSPATALESELAGEVTLQTRKETSRNLDATLGGSIPVPYADVVARVSPSIDGGVSHRETTTETRTRLPPLRAIVVSGTAHRGQGVFFKLKRTSQTTLEGVHELKVRWQVPEDWAGSEALVRCVANGRRKVLWFEQPRVVERYSAPVQLTPRTSRPGHHAGQIDASPAIVEQPLSAAESAHGHELLLEIIDEEVGRAVAGLADAVD